jgi:hypothetical protein
MSTSLPTRYAAACAASGAVCVVCGYPLRYAGARYCKATACRRVKHREEERRYRLRTRAQTEPRE